MKFTNKKKGFFIFYSHYMNKNFNKTISITVELIFRLTVQMIIKNKDTHKKYQKLHTLHVKIFVGLIPCFRSIFIKYQYEAASLYALITQLMRT